MTAPVHRRTTYEDVLHRVAVHRDDACVRVEPFDAVELVLGLLWER